MREELTTLGRGHQEKVNALKDLTAKNSNMKATLDRSENDLKTLVPEKAELEKQLKERT